MTNLSHELEDFIALARDLSYGQARLHIPAVASRGWVGVPRWCALGPNWAELEAFVSVLSQKGVKQIAFVCITGYVLMENPIQPLTEKNVAEAEYMQAPLRTLITDDKTLVMTTDSDLVRYCAGPIELLEEIYGNPLSACFDEMEEPTSSEYFRTRLPKKLQEEWLQDIADLRTLLENVEANRPPVTSPRAKRSW